MNRVMARQVNDSFLALSAWTNDCVTANIMCPHKLIYSMD